MYRILVCEDNTAARNVLCFNLEAGGFSVAAARDGLAGLEFAKQERFDLVLSDQQMPGLLGTELCEAIRCLPGYAETPVILLTAKALELDKRIAQDLDPCHINAKPFSPARLVRRVAELLNETHQRETHQRETTQRETHQREATQRETRI